MSSPRSLLDFHQWHMSSPVTMAAYRDAIERVVRPGDVVLDLGAGTGILGYQACLAGAARVYALECSDIIDLLPQFAADNGLSDRIIVRKGLSSDVELSEKADVIVASMLDSFGIDNNLLPIVLDARQRLLKPGGAIVPQSVQLSYCPVEMPEWYRASIDCWNEAYLGFNFRVARAKAVNQLHPQKITPGNLLAAPQSFDEMVLNEFSSPNAASRSSFRIERPGVLHAVAGWFRATMAEGVFCSNSPLDPAPLPWNLSLLPIGQPTPVAAGESVEIVVRADQTIWSWVVRLFGADGVLKAEFHQSTFFGLFLEGLRKHAPSTVPTLPERRQAERTVLDLCDGKRSMSEIAEAVMPRFPHRFKSMSEAMF
jgi:SAM-dependent methyltransferase